MGRENKRLINFIQVLIILVPFLIAAVPITLTAADWGDSVKDKLLKKHPRTLKGKVFLDHPITGATVQIYDRSGYLLYSVDSATGEDGSFSITRPLPETFWMVITDGWMDGEPFDHDVRRYISLFNEGDHYKVNAVTTLMAEYQDRHPELSHMQVKEAVANHLSIPDSIDLDEIIYSSEWFCYYFSHYLFMKEAGAGEGLTRFTSQFVDELVAGKTRSFYDTESVGSSYFQDAMKLLLKGALSKLGGEGTGWILGLLNLGGGDDQRFIDMQNDLNEILNDLSQIIGLLEDLAQQLALDTNRVETYIEGINAQAAITSIKTHYGPEDKDQRGSTNTIKYYSFLRSKDSDPTTKAQIATLVDHINGAWDIEARVTAIHDAIIPDIGNTNGLLDLWTKEFLLQGHVSDNQLMDYYKTLERYFGVLLFFQFKGANIVVEALNYQSSSGEQLNVSDQLQADETPAWSYLTGTFQPQIKEQTDRFLQNVVKLLANNAGLFWENRFLPGTAQEILARATWFVAQTLGEDYGMRVGVLGTKNMVDDIVNLGLNNNPGSNWAGASPVRAAEIDGRPYDSWGTLNKPDLHTLTKGTKYTLIAGDFGDVISTPGTYQVFYEPGEYRVGDWVLMGYLHVKCYTEDYVEDPDGKILYGYLLREFRLGGREAIMDESALVTDYHHNVKHGSVNWWSQDLFWGDGSLNLYVEGTNKYFNSASDIDMSWQRVHRFTFKGNQSVTAYLNVVAQAHGSIYVNHENNWSNRAQSSFSVGLRDRDTGEYYRTAGSFDDYSTGSWVDFSTTLNKQLQVTLEPDHNYEVWVYLLGNGSNSSGDYHFKATNHVSHISLTFVDSEY